jgi:PAS domain S-box-containing protein
LNDKKKTKAELLDEVAQLRQKVAELQSASSKLAEEVGRRERTEAVLEDSELRYQTLFDAIPVGVGVSDFDGNAISANPALERLAGYSREEIISLGVGSVYARPRDRERLIAALVKNGRVDDFEFRFKRKDGSTFKARQSVRIVELGGRRCILTTIVDVTERVRLSEAIAESERRFRELVEGIDDVVYSVDAEGLVDYVSPSIFAILGYQPEEMLGQPFLSFIHPDDHAAEARRFLQRDQGEIKPAEYRVIHKSGREVWVRASSRLVIDHGKVKGWRGVVTDITTLREAESGAFATVDGIDQPVIDE